MGIQEFLICLHELINNVCRCDLVAGTWVYSTFWDGLWCPTWLVCSCCSITFTCPTPVLWIPKGISIRTKLCDSNWNKALILGEESQGDTQGLSVTGSTRDMSNVNKYYLKRSRLPWVFSNKCSCCLMAFHNIWLQVGISNEHGGSTDTKCRVLGGLDLTQSVL